MLLGHNKGGVDVVAALSIYWCDLKDKVAGLALVQSPYGGTPLASDILREGQIANKETRRIIELLICKLMKLIGLPRSLCKSQNPCASSTIPQEGTADGGIKAWNVDAKRVVCDLNTSEAFPRHGSSHLDSLGFASLTVWNMKTWKAMTVLPLGKDPPAITSLSFNHNGKILAAVATDGMIHMFDVQADRYMNTLTSIFSLGVDGKVIEWSLQNQGQILWSRNCSRLD
ncbi:WD repeat-containing protein 91 homolog [Prunus yedoensis var. nudiflora]|uniref:WD repeat-containing protein 91 homolog n=1 Tax=Prunus yedoensis var. nudiflora TaxID=2094558 RepID=A0A315B5J8_PRUYE|nr:WD repeat-containing protein 91 homolog [Prunus yedoensis var. nudiflora]